MISETIKSVCSHVALCIQHKAKKIIAFRYPDLGTLDLTLTLTFFSGFSELFNLKNNIRHNISFTFQLKTKFKIEKTIKFEIEIIPTDLHYLRG